MSEQRRIEWILGARDTASDVLRGTQAQMERLHGTYQKLAGVVGVVGGGLFLRQMVQQTIEAERASLRLDAALKATGYSAEISRHELEMLAESIKASTAFDDDEVRKGLAALLRFREVQGDIFREAARLAPDLAVALDIGLIEAYQRLGRAVQDPITGMRGLRDAGIKLNEQQIETVRRLQDTGEKVRAGKIVLDELTKSVGGAAAGENSGLYGSTKALDKAWDDLLKAIGGRTLPGGQTVISKITSEVDNLSRAIKDGKILESLAAFATFGLYQPGGEPWAPGKPVTGMIRGAVSPNPFAGFTASAEQPWPGRTAGGPDIRELLAETMALGSALNVSEAAMASWPRNQKALQEIKAQLEAAKAGWFSYIDAMNEAYEAELRAIGAGPSFTQWSEEQAKEIAQLRDRWLDTLDPLRKYQEQLEEILRLGNTPGGLSAAQASAAQAIVNKSMMDEWLRLNKKTTDETVKMWETAADASQDAMRSGFFDLMQGNLSDLGAKIKRTIDGMVADMLAAQARMALFGPPGSAGAGLLGNLFQVGTQAPAPVVDAIIVPIPGAATGMDYVPRDMALMVHKGERIVPAAENRRGAKGDTYVTVNMNVQTKDANSFGNSERQIIRSLGRRMFHEMGR